jgi:hypothetical protein
MRRLPRWMPFPALLTAAVLLLGASCGTTPGVTLVATGETIKAVGTDWLAVNARFVEACKPSGPTLDPATCGAARAFGEKFKKAYPLASDLYSTAVGTNDAALAGDAKAAIRKLALEGAALAVKVGLTMREVK